MPKVIHRRTEDLDAFTTRAADATRPIPPICFIPYNLRKRKVQVVKIISTEHKSAEYQQAAVLAAEPIEVLVAIMQGQPIPRIIVDTHPLANDPLHNQLTARTEWVTPTLDQMTRAAEILSRRIPTGMRAPNGRDADHATVVARAAAHEAETQAMLDNREVVESPDLNNTEED